MNGRASLRRYRGLELIDCLSDGAKRDRVVMPAVSWSIVDFACAISAFELSIEILANLVGPRVAFSGL